MEKRLLAYMAAAAGLASAGAARAEAQVIYTPSNIPMAQGFAGSAYTELDLNNDGTPDFTFSNFSYSTHGNGGFFLKISGNLSSNEAVGMKVLGEKRITAAALLPGYQIGSMAKFMAQPRGLYLANIEHGTHGGIESGGFLKVEYAYLGLKFAINGETHYGWALVKFPGPGQFLYGSIAGYAYESTANQPIKTGQKSGSSAMDPPKSDVPAGNKNPTLGMLGAGARGLRYWRSETGNRSRP